MTEIIKLDDGSVLVPRKDRANVNIEPISLGAIGIAYVKEIVTEEACPLSIKVAALFDNSGNSFTMVKKGTPDDKVRDFYTGGIMGMGASNRWFAKYIEETYGKDSLMLFEESWFEVKDYVENKNTKQAFFYQNKINYVPTRKKVFDILEAGELATDSSVIIGLVVDQKIKIPSHKEIISDEYADLLVKNTKAIFVSAYDQESYVVWERDNLAL